MPGRLSLRVTAYHEYRAVAGGEHARDVPPVFNDELDVVEVFTIRHDCYAFGNAIAYAFPLRAGVVRIIA